MRANSYYLLLILVFGISIALSQKSKCRNKKLDKKLRNEECYKRGGYCFYSKCKGCKNGEKTKGLCGKQKLLCCIRELPTEKPTLKRRQAVCQLFGDPHIHTYDKLQYEVQVGGDFMVSKPCDSSSWEVMAHFYPAGGWAGISSVTVTTIWAEYILHDGGTVTVEGTYITLPHVDWDIHIYHVGAEINVYLRYADVVVYYEYQYEHLFVYVKETWLNQLCGLCGDWKNIDNGEKYLCPYPTNHYSWRYCENELKRILKDCPEIPIETYLRACAFDYCQEGKGGVKNTLAAAEKYCSIVDRDVFAYEGILHNLTFFGEELGK